MSGIFKLTARKHGLSAQSILTKFRKLSITDSLDMSLSELWGLLMERGFWPCCSLWACKESDTTERLNWLINSVNYTTNIYFSLSEDWKYKIRFCATTWSDSGESPILGCRVQLLISSYGKKRELRSLHCHLRAPISFTGFPGC